MKRGELNFFQNGRFLRGCMQIKSEIKIWGVEGKRGCEGRKPLKTSTFETYAKAPLCYKELSSKLFDLYGSILMNRIFFNKFCSVQHFYHSLLAALEL